MASRRYVSTSRTNDENKSYSSDSLIGIIVGAVIGGLIIIVLLTYLIQYLYRRYKYKKIIV